MTTEQPEEIPHVVRPATTDERRFIVETTAKVRQPTGVPWHVWRPIGEAAAATAVVNGAAHVVDAGGVLLGFALVYDGAVEMLYVKRDFRGEGFGLELLKAAEVGTPVPVRFTTASWRAWCRSKGLRWEEARREAAE